MGPNWYHNFPKLTSALGQGDITTASNELLNSRYASQVGSRATDNARLLQAKYGGMFNGPQTGYPMEMHGNELVAPLNPQSILAKMAQEPATDTSSPKSMAKVESTKSVDDTYRLENLKFAGIIISKLDSIKSILSDHHDTSSKILSATREI